MRAIEIAIVGFGRVAELFHLPIIRSIKGVCLVGVYDITPERKAVAKKLGLECFGSLEALARDERIQAVAVCTPTNLHYRQVKALLRHRKHVLLEKPMTLTAGEAAGLIRLAKEMRCVLTVFHNRRYDSDFLTVKQCLERQQLGRIVSIQSRVQNWGTMSPFGVECFYQNWRDERKWGGGGLYDWGSHLIDQLLQLPRPRIRTVYANVQPGIFSHDCDDFFCASIEYADGSHATLEVNYMTMYPQPRWLIIGEKATLIAHSHRPHDITAYFSHQKIEKHLAPVAGNARVICQTFVNKIRGSGELAVKPEEALRGMRLMDAFRNSARLHKSVQVSSR
jgi:scyllo-inositol 2-dehydrogenase (NADP+)